MDKCWHLLTRNGKTIGHAITDMIHIDGNPALVFCWSVLSDGEQIPAPDSIALLDRRFLHHGQFGHANCMYALPIADPRKLT